MSHGVVEKKQNGSGGGHGEARGGSSSPAPLDGGWGWVVVFASFMIHIVTDGLTYSFGIFYVEFLDYFGEGKGYTAWIGSILVGVTLCSGPISSIFVNKYGCRLVTMWGAVLASACVIISVFAQSVLTLFFTIGIGAGFGLGLIYLPAIVSVTVYFEKYRSLATGIAVCGSGVGTFLFAPLTEILISSYGWRGAMLIIGALILNCIIFGALFRPLETEIPDDFIEPPTEMTLLKVDMPNDKIYSNSHRDITDVPAIANGTSMLRSHSTDYMKNVSTRGNGRANGRSTAPGDKYKSDPETVRLALSQPMLSQSVDHARPGRSQSLKRVGSGLMSRPDVLYQGSLVHLAVRAHSATPEERSLRRSSRCSDRLVPVTGVPIEKDVPLLRDPIFIIFTLSNFLTSIGFYIPYVYIAAQAEKLGMPKDEASYLLSIIGIANSVGRIVLGYISDKPWINRLVVYNLSLAVCGIGTILSVFCTDFYSLAVYASVFGCTIGAYVGLTSVILVDLLGLDKLTDAFGLLLLFQGVASIVGSPMAGTLYDKLHSYHPGFYVSGISITISGLMLFAIPSMQRWQAKKLRLHNGQDISALEM